MCLRVSLLASGRRERECVEKSTHTRAHTLPENTRTNFVFTVQVDIINRKDFLLMHTSVMEDSWKGKESEGPLAQARPASWGKMARHSSRFCPKTPAPFPSGNIFLLYVWKKRSTTTTTTTCQNGHIFTRTSGIIFSPSFDSFHCLALAVVYSIKKLCESLLDRCRNSFFSTPRLLGNSILPRTFCKGKKRKKNQGLRTPGTGTDQVIRISPASRAFLPSRRCNRATDTGA